MTAPELTTLPNIGKILAYKLIEAGIESIQDLRSTGSERALVKIDTIDKSAACINMLYALEGAIQGIRWHSLSKEKKLELKQFYQQLKKQNASI